MFHAVPVHLQPQPPQLAHAHPQAMLAMHTAYPTTNDAAMFTGYPVTLNDGRSMMYLMPSSASPTTPAAPSWAMMNVGGPQQHFSASLTGAPVAKPDHLTPTWCAPSFPSSSSSPQQQQQQQTPSLASELRRSPTTPDGPPPYMGYKAATTAHSSATSCGLSQHPSSTAALLRPAPPTEAASYSAMSASAFDVSTTSNFSGIANGSMNMPTILRTAAPPQQQQQQQQQQQHCFWVDSATGAMKPMTQEEMSAIMASRTPATTAVPAYAMTVPPQAFNASTGSLMSAGASLSGALPYMPVVAMATVAPPPPPPPATKAVNGLQYVHGELYEGFVKRYNPNRGFGFLTATFHVKADDTASSVSGSAAVSLTTAPTSVSNHHNTSMAAMSTAKERRVPVHLGDIFVHQSYMHMQGFRTLPVGGRVRFRVGYKDGQQTFQAVDVELLPQVVPQGVEAAFINTASPTSAFSPALPSSSSAASEVEKAVGAVGSPAGSNNSEHHPEAERFFFAVPKETTLGRSPVALTQGESVEGTEEDDSPLIELAYEVYTSLEE